MPHYGGMSSRIFINYRREDSPGSAGRLYDRLAEQFLPINRAFSDAVPSPPGLAVSEIDVALPPRLPPPAPDPSELAGEGEQMQEADGLSNEEFRRPLK